MPTAPKAILFTQQVLGMNARKTGMIFWAEALARRGYETFVVTTQLSWLSRLAGNPRLASIDRDVVNRWTVRGERLHGFVWVPPVHPVRVPGRLQRPSEPILGSYPWFLPRAVRAMAADAALIVIESCAAVMLFDRLRRIAPADARFVYCASDRLGTVDMHPMLGRELARTAGRYDLIRVPARVMADDFPPDARIAFIPHGIDPAGFPRHHPTPFRTPGPHAVVAGDMLFDHESFRIMLDAAPGTTFHAFGRMTLGQLADRPNLRIHGEVPFGELATHLVHADLGVAPYLDRPAAHYLAQSSLKLIQYRHLRLPTVAPRFATAEHDNVVGYKVGDPASIASALADAAAMPRDRITTADIIDWDEVIRRVLVATELDRGAVPLSERSIATVHSAAIA